MTSLMQELYDLEINCSISTEWDSGFLVQLGDGYNGYAAFAVVRSYQEAEDFLRAAVDFGYNRVAAALGLELPEPVSAWSDYPDAVVWVEERFHEAHAEDYYVVCRSVPGDAGYEDNTQFVAWFSQAQHADWYAFGSD